jgi:hypothetical protein
MIISSTFLKNALENYNISKKANAEKFGFSNETKEGITQGMSTAFYTFLVFIGLIFFFLEFVLFYFAIYIALYCSKSREEKIVNFVLAAFFTMPYVLLNILFNPCAKNLLRTGKTGE